MEPLKEDGTPFEIIMMIKEIYSLMNSQIGSGMKASGLTNQQVMVIKILAHQKEVTLTGLCNELSLTKATMSGIIKRLEELDYVVKQKKDEDKRNTYITLSEKGNSFAYQFKQTMNNSFCNVFKDLTPDEMNKIKQALRILTIKMK